MDNAMHGIWRNRRDINGALSSFMGRRDFFDKKLFILKVRIRRERGFQPGSWPCRLKTESLSFQPVLVIP